MQPGKEWGCLVHTIYNHLQHNWVKPFKHLLHQLRHVGENSGWKKDEKYSMHFKYFFFFEMGGSSALHVALYWASR